MPAKSKSQQKLMGMAYAYKKGKMKKVSAKAKQVAHSMSVSSLKEIAETKSKNLPYKKKKAVLSKKNKKMASG